MVSHTVGTGDGKNWWEGRGNVRSYGEEERGRRTGTGQEQNDICTYSV